MAAPMRLSVSFRQVGKGRPPARSTDAGRFRRQDLARANQVVPPSENFFDRRFRVPRADRVTVDGIGSQPFPARRPRLLHFLALIASAFGSVPGRELDYICGQHDALAMALHEFAQEAIRLSRSCTCGGVNEVVADLPERVVRFFAARPFYEPRNPSREKVVAPSAASQTRGRLLPKPRSHFSLLLWLLSRGLRTSRRAAPPNSNSEPIAA